MLSAASMASLIWCVPPWGLVKLLIKLLIEAILYATALQHQHVLFTSRILFVLKSLKVLS